MGNPRTRYERLPKKAATTVSDTEAWFYADQGGILVCVRPEGGGCVEVKITARQLREWAERYAEAE